MTGNKFFLSFHYKEGNSYLFVNGTEITKVKAKDSEINAILLCLGNMSKDLLVYNMKKKTGFYGYVFDFRADYDAITADDILEIHNYSMKKHGKV